MTALAPAAAGRAELDRVVVLGGTSFIGRAITEHLVGLGCEVLVVHRGLTEPAELPAVRHLHTDRADVARHRQQIADFAPDAAVEVYAMNGSHADAALAALPAGIGLVALSSVDVYRAFESLHAGRQTDVVPLRETSALRRTRFLVAPDDENLEVEEGYLARGGVVLRLGAVYGPHDPQRRFEFMLRRLRAGRRRIPIGSGGLVFSKVYAADVAAAVWLALSGDVGGEVFNIAESSTAPIRLYARQILDAAGATDVELVTVPDAALPKDLAITGAVSQHLSMDSAKARDLLGWHESDYRQVLTRSVQWHIRHPPRDWNRDFSADDEALRAVAR